MVGPWTLNPCIFVRIEASEQMVRGNKQKSIYPREIKGMTTDQAEKWLLDHGGIPDWWLDPIAKSEAIGTGITNTIIEAHLGEFEKAYVGRLGKNARGIGYSRNVEGQGIPGEKSNYLQNFDFSNPAFWLLN